MAILRRMGNILVTGAAVGAVITLGTTSAFAAGKATTWTIKPGGAFTVKAASMTLTDTTSNQTLTCSPSSTSPISLTLKGSLKAGSGLSGTKIGKIGAVTIANCSIAGFAVTMKATVPWHYNFKSYSSGTTTGTITGIKASLAVPGVGCSGTVGGATSTSTGTLAFTYANPTTSTGAGTLTILTTGGNLHAWNTSGCLGVVNNNDALTISATATTTHQVITSP